MSIEIGIFYLAHPAYLKPYGRNNSEAPQNMVNKFLKSITWWIYSA